ncbi:MAG TPA: response regulator transcription factor [Pirellulales bacterium]|nr:response regulator transcription factor [Pirellulales bacterium]
MAKRKTKMSGRRARVLIVDDHPAVREALAIRIAGEADLEVCGEAADYADAVKLAAATRPDVAVIDLGLKSGNGIDLIKRLCTEHEQLLTIVWSMYSEELYAERALRAGARGYINKEQATTMIVEAIRQVLDGNLYLSPAMTEKLLQRHVGIAAKSTSRDPIESLSTRELDVLRLIGQGVKTMDIARQMHLSTKTVETYRDRIKKKLGLAHSTELAQFAAQSGL